MADPVSIIGVIGTVVSVVGTVVSAVSQRSASQYNAQIADQNAMIARNNAEFNAEQQQRAARLKIGAATANYGASGISMEGSPPDVLESSARNAEIDRQAIIYQGQVRAAGYTDQATLDTMQADNAMSSGIFKGIGDLASGFSTPGAAKFLTQGPGVGPIATSSAFYNPFSGGAISTAGVPPT
jgi:hypothetical protein